MAAHSSILAWRIPWTGEPGGLQSMGSQRLSSTQACLFPNSRNMKYIVEFVLSTDLNLTV